MGRVAIVGGIAGGFIAGATYGVRGLLARQAALARREIGKPLGEEALFADKRYRPDKAHKAARKERPIELAVLGDSIAAGLGAHKPKHTLGAGLARRLARASGRSVRLRTAAVVGSESSALADQIAWLGEAYCPDVAIIIVGGNDVTHRVPVSVSVGHLRQAIEDLRARGAEVVVGTCPDLGALRAVPQPLRALGSRASRQLAAAQRETALAGGAWAVSLAHVVGPFFITNPDEMFSLDRFHPSTMGYKRTARALLPSVLAALGHAEDVPFGHHGPPGRGTGASAG